MRKPVQIRITQNDRAEYERLAKSTKSKLKRTVKNYGIDLTEDIPVPKLTDFQTRTEFNLWKQKASSFTNRNNLNYRYKKNQHGVVATVKELNEIERNNKLNQRKAKEEIKKVSKLPIFSQGKKVGTVGQRLPIFGRENPTGINIPSDFKFNSVKTRRDLERKMDVTKTKTDPNYYDKRKEQMKENFKSMLEKTFNSLADDLIREIDDIPADDFYELYLMFFRDFDFDIYYTSDENVDIEEGKIKLMTEHIGAYKNGFLNLDMKPF